MPSMIGLAHLLAASKGDLEETIETEKQLQKSGAASFPYNSVAPESIHFSYLDLCFDWHPKRKIIIKGSNNKVLIAMF